MENVRLTVIAKSFTPLYAMHIDVFFIFYIDTLNSDRKLNNLLNYVKFIIIFFSLYIPTISFAAFCIIPTYYNNFQ